MCKNISLNAMCVCVYFDEQVLLYKHFCIHVYRERTRERDSYHQTPTWFKIPMCMCKYSILMQIEIFEFACVCVCACVCACLCVRVFVPVRHLFTCAVYEHIYTRMYVCIYRYI